MLNLIYFKGNANEQGADQGTAEKTDPAYEGGLGDGKLLRWQALQQMAQGETDADANYERHI